jgi:NADH:ubiquinone oxidoreductase subunit E
MGGSELLVLEDFLNEEQKAAVELEGSMCCGFCKSGGPNRSPIVLIDGEVLEKATVQSVIAKLDVILSKRAGA